MECKHCNEEIDPTIVELLEGPHYASANCPICRRFIKFLPKPQNEGIRTKSSKYSLDQLAKHNCEICTRRQSWLGDHESLEIHHKIPIGENGEDTKENILVLCTSCHRLVHHQRLYVGQHLRRKYEVYEIIKSHLIDIAKDQRDYESLIAVLTDFLGI